MPLSIFAPGRVNLIGEHIDYSGLSVFPMAIRRGVRLSVTPRVDANVQVTNDDPRFVPTTFAISRQIEPASPGHWTNYVRAAVQATVSDEPSSTTWRGFRAHVQSDLPAAAGLSSSSALLIAAGLAFRAVNDRAVDKLAFAERMADAERYVGVRGGGMDQAICVGATEHCASRVDFDPLRLEPTRIPTDWAFVVAHSLVSAEKAGAARAGYNQRTIECRHALERLWPVLNVEGDEEAMSYPRLLAARSDIDSMCRLADTHLAPELAARFRHTITEATRVTAAQAAMRSDDLTAFGRHMLASHASLRDDFGVSSPELNRLVDLAMRFGATGARLTGAGFGGCVIAACERSRLPAILTGLADEYYGPRGVADDRRGDVLFEVHAGPGASIEQAGLQ